MGEAEPYKSHIYLRFNPESKKGYIFFVSEEISPEKPEDNKQKEIEKAKEDF